MNYQNGYNSGYSTEIEENIEFDKEKNGVSISKIARELNFKNALVIQDPFTILDEYRNFLLNEDNLDEIEVPEDRAYRPEAMSQKIYGTPDLWYIILIVNKMKNYIELKPGMKIKYLRKQYFPNLATIIGKFKLSNADLGDAEERWYNPDHTLIDIDDD